MDGCGLILVSACQEYLGNAVQATEGTPYSSYKMEHFNYKDEWQMHTDAFKRRLAFCFTIINLA